MSASQKKSKVRPRKIGERHLDMLKPIVLFSELSTWLNDNTKSIANQVVDSYRFGILIEFIYIKWPIHTYNLGMWYVVVTKIQAYMLEKGGLV